MGYHRLGKKSFRPLATKKAACSAIIEARAIGHLDLIVSILAESLPPNDKIEDLVSAM
jgi:hypothetical protein